MSADTSDGNYQPLIGGRRGSDTDHSSSSLSGWIRFHQKAVCIGIFLFLVIVIFGIIVPIVIIQKEDSSSVIPLPLGNNTIQNITVYVSGSNPSDVLIFFTDIFGLTDNSRAMADKFASMGDMTVVVPDLFAWKKPGAANNMTESLMIAHIVTQQLQLQGYSSFIGIGYCYGGRPVVNFNIEGITHASISAHGGGLNCANDASNIRTPIFFIQPENDPGFNNQAQCFQTAINDNHIQNQFKIYPGMNHGFAAAAPGTANYNATMKQLAFQDSLDWFNKFR